MLHIGVEHCPVCELVHHNEQAAKVVAEWRRTLDPQERAREALRAELRGAMRNPLIASRYRR
jgi:Zn-finger protein